MQFEVATEHLQRLLDFSKQSIILPSAVDVEILRAGVLCRKAFRPIAPVCLAEEMKAYFAAGRPSPYMLEFRQVTSSSIPAVTHADGSARPQSITGRENPELYSLMRSFHRQCGLAVLCNTSLNFNGRGFINRLSDLKNFSLTHGLDGFVFNNRFFRRRAEETS